MWVLNSWLKNYMLTHELKNYMFYWLSQAPLFTLRSQGWGPGSEWLELFGLLWITPNKIPRQQSLILLPLLIIIRSLNWDRTVQRLSVWTLKKKKAGFESRLDQSVNLKESLNPCVPPCHHTNSWVIAPTSNVSCCNWAHPIGNRANSTNFLFLHHPHDIMYLDTHPTLPNRKQNGNNEIHFCLNYAEAGIHLRILRKWI